MILSAAGRSVATATTGLEAIGLLREEGLRPGLIVLDMQLPKMSGLDVVQEIRRAPELRDLRVLALTAHAMPGDPERFIAAGCNAYLSKPIDTRAFVRHVSALLAGATEIEDDTSHTSET
ncbi:MAG: two-component system response regulator [Gemmatimonadetes bacterium]|nr:two-component system response regulator [Gemmatimonadota bacterium]